MKIGDLFVNLFFKADDTKLKDFIHNLGDLRMSSLLNTLGLAEMYEGIKKVMEIADRTALTINNFTGTTGQSAAELQQWSKVAQQVGQDASIVGNSVTHLMDSVTRLSKTGEGATFWQMLGIDPRGFSDGFQLLLEVGKKIDGLSVNEKRFKLGLLGLDPGLIPVLDYIVHNQQELGRQLQNNEEQLALMQEHHRVISRLSADWNTLMTNIGSKLEPVVDFFLNIADSVIRIANGLSHLIGPLMFIAGIALTIAGALNPVLGALTRTTGISMIGAGAAMTAGDIANIANPKFASQGDRTQNNNLVVHVNGGSAQDISERTIREYENFIINKAQSQQHLPNN